MRLSPTRFNRHLQHMGQEYLWRRSWQCSCVNPNSGSPDTKCKICLGKGRYWEAPVQAVAASSSQKTQQSWAAMGLYELGDLVLTTPENSPIWDAGQFDRITMLNATDRFSSSLIKGDPSERLLFKPESIERVFWINKTTNVIVEGGIPTVNDKGELTWGEKAPPPGMSYSITGMRFSEYYIFTDLPKSRNMHSGVRLPKYVVLRRFDLFGR